MLNVNSLEKPFKSLGEKKCINKTFSFGLIILFPATQITSNGGDEEEPE